MSLSPQQIQELLATAKRLKKPALSVVSSPQHSTQPQPVAPPPRAVGVATPQPQPQAQAIPQPAPQPSPSAETSKDELSDFSSFSGIQKRQPSLPRGAKNVKCHTVERDPDTGKIARVYTYDLEEEPQSGDQISRQPEEQPTGSD